MLEHVGIGQTRFTVPGLTADARGVAHGRWLVIVLPSIDRVVSLLAALSDRGLLIDVVQGVRLTQVRSTLGTSELVVQLPISNSHLADAYAAVGRLTAGLVFTGSAKHFVRYRDSRSPLGYDADSVRGGEADYVLYASAFVQTYTIERTIALERLLCRLGLLRQRQEHDDEEPLLLRVEPGLWPAVLGYLHRKGVAVSAAATDARPRAFFLIRGVLPAAMRALFARLPGVVVYRHVSESVAIEYGFQHPVDLVSCAAILGKDLKLFSGTLNAVDVVEAPVQFVSAAALTDFGRTREPVRVRSVEPASGLSMKPRLIRSFGPRPRVIAVRVPTSEVSKLKQLVYLMPPNVFGTYRVCETESAIHVVSESGVDFIPVGQMFWSPGKQVFIPLGFQLQPRVAPELLVEQLGGRNDDLFFLPEMELPIRIAASAWVPLGRAVFSALEVHNVETSDLEAEAESEPVSLVNDDAGVFPLWSFDDKL